MPENVSPLVGERVVWFDSPEQALSNPPLFLAHLMVYGTLEEVLAVKQHFTDRDFQNVLDNPPAGVFDSRSWAYWNLVFGHQPPTTSCKVVIIVLPWPDPLDP